MKVMRMKGDVMNSGGNDLHRPSAGNGRMTESAKGRTGGGAYPGAYPGGLSRVQRLSAQTGEDEAKRPLDDKPAAKNSGKVEESKGNKRAKESWPEEDGEEKRSMPTWAKVAFWLFRKSIVPVIMIVMLIAGLYIGYVYLGKASKDDVFEWSTWQHLYNLIFAES